MNIVHINVRLSEGGAARIALDLHQRSLASGLQSSFFYGYGSGAKPSVYEAEIQGATHLGNRPAILGNFALHRLFGVEAFPPRGLHAQQLQQAISQADVVHLHAIHSYFMPFDWLTGMLAKTRNLKIVWTCHDFWPITGRCAFLEGCQQWQQGCGTCPTQSNYPPALFDFSAAVFRQRRKTLLPLLDRLTFAAPSEFVRQQFIRALPDARIETVYNGLDAELENALSATQIGRQPDETLRIVVMANDLSDATKVDAALVRQIMQLPQIELHTIGRNSPFEGPNSLNHGEVFQRSELVQLLSGMDALLFSSQKDTFGLVMIEAMACGVPVLALPSDAAREVLQQVSQAPLPREDLLALLAQLPARTAWLQQQGNQLAAKVRQIFGGERMFAEYLQLYKRPD